MRKFYQGVTFKLMVLVAIVGSVPLSILGGFTFFSTKTSIEAGLHEQLRSITHDSARFVINRLNEISAQVELNPEVSHPLVTNITTSLPENALVMQSGAIESPLFIELNKVAIESQFQSSVLGNNSIVYLDGPIEKTGPGFASMAIDHPLLIQPWFVHAHVPLDDFYAPIRQLNWVMWSLWVVSLLTALLIGYYAAKHLLNPLHALLNRLTNIASGDADLTQQVNIHGHDEFAEVGIAFNKFVGKLRHMVKQLAATSESLASEAQQSLNSTEQSQQSLNHQHAQVEQVATAMNEMTTTVHEVAKNTQQAADIANSAMSKTNEGSNVVSMTIASINKLANDVESAAQVIAALKEESTRISSILDAIRGIAEQTNLLALNAAIEAARAGEAGRGFAVVADEVRSLAIRVSDATDEIHRMITTLQHRSDEAVAVMDQGREQATKSVQDARQTGTALESIHQAIYQINDMNMQVATASEEQSSVAEEINKSVVTISDLAYATAEQANEVAGTSRKLNELAANTQGIVSQFRY